ncbi:PREDICTED: uncharacterized protein LOC108613315 [Drosophila arizonae]|uniref:Uncharacterized protein LOC108613315 n=1 Tax=Drosophila arizonae TaxID=7263 RepID=A0ABM1P4P5_DROAR|nr:PREDICTED: uncharacterized protein LOC108613315 [Drosophila arizonae]
MGTPRKGFNYYAPYSQNVRQYPSQNTEYMSQHNGGQQTPQRPNPSTPHFYQNRTPQQQNVGFYEDRQGSSSANTPHFYQIKTPHQQYGTPRNFCHRGRGGGDRRGQHQNKKRFSDRGNASQYFHSSMLEDPWRELMERHNAIHGSVLSDPQTDSIGSDEEFELKT